MHGIRSFGVGILLCAGLACLAVHAVCLVVVVGIIAVLLALGSVHLVWWLIVALIRVLTVVAVHGIDVLALGTVHHVVLDLVIVLSLVEILSFTVVLSLIVALPLIVILPWTFHELAVLLLSVRLLRLLIALRAFLGIGCALRHGIELRGFSYREEEKCGWCCRQWMGWQ